MENALARMQDDYFFEDKPMTETDRSLMAIWLVNNSLTKDSLSLVVRDENKRRSILQLAHMR